MKKAVLLVVAGLKLLLFIGSSALILTWNSPASARSVAVNQSSPLGINTNEAMETDASLPFVDLFRFALPFEAARPWLTKGKISYDKNGWPRALNGGQAGTRFLNNIPVKALPGGTYTVRYEGEGQLQYGGGAKLIKRSPGKDLIRLVSADKKTITATLYIMKSNPRNYVRNIRVLMSGGICRNNPFRRAYSAKQCGGQPYSAFADHYKQITFNPAYLTFMKNFKVIRFMNMSGITRNNLRHWKNRPNLTEATWGGPEGQRGVPVEIMVKLANQLDINPWFNMPHNADDDYVSRFAGYVKRHLKPTLSTYVEYTNEAWNPIFVPQAEHMKQNGTRQKLDADRRIAGFKYYSKQSVRVFNLWERAFGGPQRLVRVMGGMTTDLAMTETILAYNRAYQHVDAVAIAPYFYIAQDKLKALRSVNNVFSALAAKDNRYSIDNLLKLIRQQSEVARAYGVDLIAYEGGQHLVDHKTHKMTEGATPHLVAANRDPRMASQYQRLLAGWKAVGGHLFVAFSAPRPPTWHGSWGIKEHIGQPDATAPKYRALQAFNRGTPCWWKGCRTNRRHNLTKPQFVPNDLRTGKAAVAKAPTVARIRHGSADLRRAKSHHLTTLIKGTLNNIEDLSAEWRASWNEREFNFSIAIDDDRLMSDSDQPWADDSVEVYIDANSSRGSKFDGRDDFQFVFHTKNQSLSLGGSSPKRDIRSIRHAMFQMGAGYRLDVSIPWKVLGIKPRAGLKMGFDVHVNDDDNGNLRDAKMSWNAPVDKAWKHPNLFGTVVLNK